MTSSMTSALAPTRSRPFGRLPLRPLAAAHSDASRFLNAFWEELEPHAEQMWAYVSKCNDLDAEHHELGTGLDEVRSRAGACEAAEVAAAC